jgi:hypothetical protein
MAERTLDGGVEGLLTDGGFDVQHVPSSRPTPSLSWSWSRLALAQFLSLRLSARRPLHNNS